MILLKQLIITVGTFQTMITFTARTTFCTTI